MTKEEKLKACRFYGKKFDTLPRDFNEIMNLERAWVEDNSSQEDKDKMLDDYRKYYKRIANAGLNINEELAAYLCMRYGKFFSVEGILEKLQLPYMDF